MTLPFGLEFGLRLDGGGDAGCRFLRGYSGFGYSALVIAASSLVTSPLNFVAVVVLLEFAMSLQAWRGAGPDVDWRRVGFLLAGAAVGLPLGLGR